MERLSPKTAPTLSRKLVKRTGFTRQQLSTISKAEEGGDESARAERLLLADDFERRHDDAIAAAERTLEVGMAFAAASAALQVGQAEPKADTLPARLAARCVRLGLAPSRRSRLASLCKEASTRAISSAEAAKDRLDDNHDDILATRLLARLLNALPDANFNPRDPSISAIRREYQARANAAKKRNSKK